MATRNRSARHGHAFLKGMASAIDLGATLRNYYTHPVSPREADYNALKSDWERTGSDISGAISEFKEETNAGRRNQ